MGSSSRFSCIPSPAVSATLESEMSTFTFSREWCCFFCATIQLSIDFCVSSSLLISLFNLAVGHGWSRTLQNHHFKLLQRSSRCYIRYRLLVGIYLPAWWNSIDAFLECSVCSHHMLTEFCSVRCFESIYLFSSRDLVWWTIDILGRWSCKDDCWKQEWQTWKRRELSRGRSAGCKGTFLQ